MLREVHRECARREYYYTITKNVLVELLKFYLNYIYIHICNTWKIIPAFSHDSINFHVIFCFLSRIALDSRVSRIY